MGGMGGGACPFGRGRMLGPATLGLHCCHTQPHHDSSPAPLSPPPLQAGWAMAEGVLSYRCNAATKTLKLGVEGDGQYA